MSGAQWPVAWALPCPPGVLVYGWWFWSANKLCCRVIDWGWPTNKFGFANKSTVASFWGVGVLVIGCFLTIKQIVFSRYWLGLVVKQILRNTHEFSTRAQLAYRNGRHRYPWRRIETGRQFCATNLPFRELS
mmetsp:Transcript_5616/g.8719  ORF Transcript_5616/g.8719 Transcript_5616/m.8719 type:complete len:132 (-) Transcript_5616:463-858(-)